MNNMHLVLHGIAIKKHSTIEEVASVIDIDPVTVESLVNEAASQGRVIKANGKYSLTPAAQMILNGEYPKFYSELRNDDSFISAYKEFEKINNKLKTIMTNWQVISIGGEEVTNDHSDSHYDNKIIEKLGDLHEHVEKIIDRLSAKLPRLKIYKEKLLKALEKAEDGEIQWVSDARIESYHTVWFELHEDLLRICGRKREE